MTTKLHDISLHRLHHPELAQLLHRTIEDFKAANLKARDEDFTRLLNALKTQLPTLQAALQEVKSSEKSQSIQELDVLRDRALRSLFDSIKPYRYSAVATEKQAYTALSLLFKQYKGLTKKNFEEESSLIGNLLTKLASPEYADDVTALNLTKFITTLTTAQTNFEATFNARSKEYATKVDYDVKALRNKASDDYRLLCEYVHVLARVKSDNFYTQALDLLNNSRKYYSDTIARRKGEKKEATTEVAE